MTALSPTLANNNRHLVPSRLWAAGLLAACLILIGVSARDGLQNLWTRWWYEDEYGYGLVILALMPFLLWRCWHQITATSGGTRWPGLAILAAAQLCAVIAALGESYYLEQVALIVSLLGVALLAFGSRTIRIFMPLTVLLLMTVPLPYTLQAMLTVKLQLISTALGVAIIQLLRIPVFADGNIIDLGNFKLQVAEACSGLRYLLPLTCISFIVAYLYRAPFWKRVVLVLSATPITIAINSFRIAMTALLVNSFGTQMAEGFLHEFEGWAIFLIGALLLLIEIFALQGFRWSKVNIESILDRQPVGQYNAKSLKSARPLLLAVLVCAGAVGASTSIVSALSSAPNPVRESFVEFPRKIGPWTGHAQVLEQDVEDVLKATDYYNGDFVEEHGGPGVNLFVAYYESLAKSAAIHSPRVCLPGAGWEFADFQERNFSEIVPGSVGTFNYVVVQKGEIRMLMYYWYQQRERHTANEFGMKYYLLVDNLFKSRKDGALVRLMTPISAADSQKGEAAADARLHAFAQVMLSRMPSYLPQ